MREIPSIILPLLLPSCLAWTSQLKPQRSSFSKLSPSSLLSTTPSTTSPTSSQSSSTTTTVTTSPTGHDNTAWIRGYSDCPTEIPPTSLPIPTLPDDFPTGTYYRNGHARFTSPDGIRTYHMFDGDGMVSMHALDPSTKTMTFCNRFVRTLGFVEDEKSGSSTRPGIFGTKVSGGFLANCFRTDFKNVGNTNVLYTNDNLYALWEGGLPWKLNPMTLETDVSEPNGHTLGGLLASDDKFAAHFRVDPVSGHICNFGQYMNPTAGTTEVRIYELTPEMTPVFDEKISFSFEGAGVLHDFCMTENWYIFAIPPASVNKNRALLALLGQTSFASSIDFDNEATESMVYLIPRPTGSQRDTTDPGGDRVRKVKIPYNFAFHYCNAFEDEFGNVFFDVVCTDEALLGLEYPKDKPIWESVTWDEIPPTMYTRFGVDPKRESLVVGLQSKQIISTQACEFPSVPKQLQCRKHRYAYTVGSHKPYPHDKTSQNNKVRGSGPAGSILKLNCDDPTRNEAYSFEPHEFAGEPIFVAKVGADVLRKGEEDKGYVVAHVHNGRDLTTDLCIFDVEGAGALERGPVVRVRLPTFVPFGLHGNFVEGLRFES